MKLKWLIIGLCAINSGCELCDISCRNIVYEKCLRTDTLVDHVKFHHMAAAAWAHYQRDHHDAAFTADFAAGYIDGFATYLQEGGNGAPPGLPPKRYWKPHYQSPEGHQAVDDWFAGYRLGAAEAVASGLRESVVVPSAESAGEVGPPTEAPALVDPPAAPAMQRIPPPLSPSAEPLPSPGPSPTTEPVQAPEPPSPWPLQPVTKPETPPAPVPPEPQLPAEAKPASPTSLGTNPDLQPKSSSPAEQRPPAPLPPSDPMPAPEPPSPAQSPPLTKEEMPPAPVPPEPQLPAEAHGETPNSPGTNPDAQPDSWLHATGKFLFPPENDPPPSRRGPELVLPKEPQPAPAAGGPAASPPIDALPAEPTLPAEAVPAPESPSPTQLPPVTQHEATPAPALAGQRPPEAAKLETPASPVANADAQPKTGLSTAGNRLFPPEDDAVPPRCVSEATLPDARQPAPAVHEAQPGPAIHNAPSATSAPSEARQAAEPLSPAQLPPVTTQGPGPVVVPLEQQPPAGANPDAQPKVALHAAGNQLFPLEDDPAPPRRVGCNSGNGN